MRLLSFSVPFVLLYCVIQNQCCTKVTFVNANIKVARSTITFNLHERFTAKVTGCITPEILTEQSGVMNITIVECYNQSVPILYERAVSNLPQLDSMVISYSKVKKIKEKPFHNLPRLTSLTLSYNEIEVIDRNAFTDLNLVILDLSENKIAFLDSGIFTPLPKLKYLFMHSNDLEVFEPEWFPENPVMYQIDLHNNFIRSIHKNTFKTFKTLNVLDLNSNSIQFIHKDAFDALEILDTLYLYNNRIRKLEPDVFKGLKNIGSIWIHGNNLTYLSDRILQDLKSPNLFQFTIHTNPWQCACYNKIAKWSTERNVFIVTGIECYNDNNPVCLYPTENEDLCLEDREEDLNKIFYEMYNVGNHTCAEE